MEEKKKMSFSRKLRIIMLCVVIIGINTYSTIFYFVARNSIVKNSIKECQMNSGFAMASVWNSIAMDKNLILQLSKSPSIIEFCKNPKNASLIANAYKEADPYGETITGKTALFGSSSETLMHIIPSNTTMEVPADSLASFKKIFAMDSPYSLEVRPGMDGSTWMWINGRVMNGKSCVGFTTGGAPMMNYCNKIISDLDEDVNIIITDDQFVPVATRDPDKLKNVHSLKDLFGEKVEKEIKEASLNLQTKANIVVKDFNGIYCLAVVPQINWYVLIYHPIELKDIFTGKSNLVLYIILFFLIILTSGIYITLTKLNDIREKEINLGNSLLTETQNLVVATKETAATSQDQSAAVKEIVATMEDSNALSENISQKIKDVSEVAQKTTCDVSDGAYALSVNVQKLHEIFDANQQTINGIKLLGDKIDNIWDIVTLINSVADQAKIIAFNAELEAASAGEAGKNFHIVASEIRRLADGIIDGTKEIKERINEIQQSSDSLILASESGTEKINEGCDAANELESKFTSIKSAAEITASSAEDISGIIQQQAVGSSQILITLKQISAGVENFTSATENISSSAEALKNIAGDLNKSVNTTGNKNGEIE